MVESDSDALRTAIFREQLPYWPLRVKLLLLGDAVVFALAAVGHSFEFRFADLLGAMSLVVALVTLGTASKGRRKDRQFWASPVSVDSIVALRGVLSKASTDLLVEAMNNDPEKTLRLGHLQNLLQVQGGQQLAALVDREKTV